MAKQYDLLKARDALKIAKQALKDAERKYDRECEVNTRPFIKRIRVAEAKVRAAREALREMDPGNKE
jgi:hypothetical protein